MKKNILLVNGSLRKDSFNQSIVDYIKIELEAKGYETTQAVISDLPFFNQDIEMPAPSSVERLREKMKRASALWIVTPEYNGSVPGGLKNFLDWISRPVEKGVFGPPDFVKGKLVAVSGAAGRSGAALVIQELTGLLTRMALKPLEKTTGLILPTEAFQTGKFILSDEQKKALNEQIELFIQNL
ncbi:NADPH-dependent FMN reductase [Fusobacterium russii]|uniref:NADPH-dependent FMN reductase n=1 Tax=Fusobacterium russii TaxID=854 RepID=UPI0003A832C2|nr:NADPH-dependent FMN reductase [Fusobacterium russii]